MTENPTEEKNVPIAATYEGVLQLALTSRRGQLMKAAKLPQPEDCTAEDIPTLCQNIEKLNGMIGELINLVGEKETQLKRAMEAHEIVEETFDNWQKSLDGIRAGLVVARSTQKEARKIYGELIEEVKELGKGCS